MTDIYDVEVHGVSNVLKRCGLLSYYLAVCGVAYSLRQLRELCMQVSPDKRLLEKDHNALVSLWREMRQHTDLRCSGQIELHQFMKMLNGSTSVELTSYYAFELDKGRERGNFPALNQPEWCFAHSELFGNPTDMTRDNFNIEIEGERLAVGIAIHPASKRFVLRIVTWKRMLTAALTTKLLELPKSTTGARLYNGHWGSQMDFCWEFSLDEEFEALFTNRCTRAWVINEQFLPWLNMMLGAILPSSMKWEVIGQERLAT